MFVTSSHVDPLAQADFKTRFELMFLKANGDAFQVLFGRIMNMAYPGDFVQTRPWGKLGDAKCDGYLRSERRFYQCYAPQELEKSDTLRKLHEDFSGAAPHASKFFDHWVFVHNGKDGRIPTWLLFELDELRKKNLAIQIEPLGFVEMQQLLFSLPGNDLVSLLGAPATQRAMLSLGLDELRPILNYLEQLALPLDQEAQPVSPRKLEYNTLSSEVEVLLKAGMTKSRLVGKYIKNTTNKELGMRVATAFRKEYRRIRTETPLLGGAEIFDRLRRFATGPYQLEACSDVAVLAVLAYLFEECDIFDNPPAGHA